MEDEVFNTANDNYFYLWPPLEKSMGEFGSGNDVYSYWLTFRAMTEQFGTGVAGGGEDVMRAVLGVDQPRDGQQPERPRRRPRAEGRQPTRRVPRGRDLDPLREDVRRRLRVSVPPRGGAVYRSLVGTYQNDDAINSIGGGSPTRCATTTPRASSACRRRAGRTTSR